MPKVAYGDTGIILDFPDTMSKDEIAGAIKANKSSLDERAKAVPVAAPAPDSTTVDLSGVNLNRPRPVYEPSGMGERFGAPAQRPMPVSSYEQKDYEQRIAGKPKDLDARALLEAIPFGGGVNRGTEAQQLQAATIRAKDGKATPDDLQILKAAQLDAARGMTTPAQIGAGVAGSVRMGGQAAIGSLAGPAGAIAGMAGDPGTIMSRYAAQQTPETAIEMADGKPTGNIILGAPPSDSQKEAIAKVAMLQASDAIIEMFGGKATSAVMGAVGGAATKQLAKRLPATSEAVKAFAKRYSDNTAAQMLERAQIHGIAPEYLEEVMQSASAAAIGEPGADPAALLDPTNPEAFNTMMVIGVLNSPRLLGMFQQRQQPKNDGSNDTADTTNPPPVALTVEDEQDFTDEELMSLFAGEQAQPAAPQQTPFAPIEGQRLPADTLTMPNEAGTPFAGVPAQPRQSTAAPTVEQAQPQPMQRPSSFGVTPRFTAQQAEGPQVEPVPFGTQWDRKVSPLEALGMMAGVDMSQPAEASDQLVNDTITAMSTPRPQQSKPVPVRAVEALYDLAGDKGELTISAMDESITDFVDAFEPSERKQALDVWAKMRAEIDAMPEEDQDAWASQLLGRQQEAPQPAPTAPVEAAPVTEPTPLRAAFDRYDSTGDITGDEFVAQVEGLIESGDAPKKLRKIITKYKRARALHRESGYRMDDGEEEIDALAAAVEASLGASTTSPAVESKTPHTFDASKILAAATREDVLGAYGEILQDKAFPSPEQQKAYGDAATKRLAQIEAAPAPPTPTPVQPEIVAPQAAQVAKAAGVEPIKAIHYSRTPMKLSKGADVSKIKGAYPDDSTFGHGFYAMEPVDEEMWKGVARFSLGEHRNEVSITPSNPLIISPDTVRERGFDAIKADLDSGKHDAIISRGWSEETVSKVYDRTRQLWTPKYPEGQTRKEGRFTNFDELDSATSQAIVEVTGLDPADYRKMQKADWMQNQIFIPADAAPDIVSTPAPAKPKRTPPPAKGSTSATGWSTVAKGVARKDMQGHTVEIVRQTDGSWAVTRDEKEVDSGYKSRAEAEKYADGELAQDIRDQRNAEEEERGVGEGAVASPVQARKTPEQEIADFKRPSLVTKNAKIEYEPRNNYSYSISSPDGKVMGWLKDRDIGALPDSPTRGEIFHIGVNEKAQRKGVGLGLMKDAVRMMRANGIETVVVRTPGTAGGKALTNRAIKEGILGQQIGETMESGTAEFDISGMKKPRVNRKTGPAPADTGIFRDLTAAARAGQRFVEDLHVRIAPTLARIHAAAKSPVEFLRAAVAKIGEHIRPYARRFLADVRKVGAEFAANPTRGSVPKDAKPLGKRELEAEYRQGAKDVQRTVKGEKALSSREATAEEREKGKAASEEAFGEGRKSGIHIGGMRTMKEMREFLDIAKQALPADQYAARIKVINKLMSQGVPKTDKARARLNRFFDSTRRQVFKAQTIKGVIKQSKKLKSSMPKMEAGLKATVKDILDTFSEAKPTDATINKAEALILAVTEGKKVASPKALEQAEKAIDTFINDKSLASMPHDALHRLKAVLENLNGLHEGNLEKLREAQKEREQKYADSAKEVKENTEKPFDGDEQNRRGILQFLFNEAGMNIFNKIMALAPEGSILHDLAIKTPDAGENRESGHRIAARDHMMDGLSKLKGSDGKPLVSRNPGDDSFTLHPEFTRMSFMLSDYANKTLIGKAIARAVKRDPILVRTRLADGSSIYLTGAERARLYQLGLDPNARYQMTREGGEGVYITRKATDKIQKITPADLAEIESQLTKNEKAIGRLIFEFDNTVAKDAVNEMSRKEFGRDLFAEDDKASYRRYRHDQKASQMDAHVGKTFIENQSMLKDIKGGTSPIILGDAFSEYFSHQARVAAIVGRMVPSMRLRELVSTEAFREAVRKTSKNGENVLRDIERTFDSYGEISGEPDTAMWMVNGVLSRLASSWLGLNPKTIITTPMSIWSAQSRIPVKHLLKNMSLRTRDAKVLAEMRKHAPKMYEMTTSSGFNIVSPETTGESAQKFFGKGARGHEKGQFFLHEANNIPALMTWNAAKSWGEEQGLKGEELMAFTAEKAQDAYSVAQPDNRWIYTSGAKLAARKSAAWRVWTFLQGQTSKQYNQAVEGMIRYSYSGKTKADKARMLKDVAVPTFGQALLYTAVGYALKAGYDELDELRSVERKKRLTEGVDGFLFDFTTSALEGNIPVAGGLVGDGLRVAKAAAKGEPPNRATRDSGSVLGRPAVLIYSMLDASVRAMADPTDKSVARARKSIIEAASLFGFDTSLINELIDSIE